MCSADLLTDKIRENHSTRNESDSLGSKNIPAEAYWGIHTARALENFPLAGRPMHREIFMALLQIKLACAQTNEALGYLPKNTATAIRAACLEGLEGGLDHAWIVDALQGGAGTSANMNINEVLANRAEELLGGKRGEYKQVNPLDHVNLHQSTNDVFPTAIRIAAIRRLRVLEKAIAHLQSAFQDREQSFRDVVKIGRTQLQDAVPMTLGAECSAWAECLSRDRWRVFKCEERLRVINLGGTAVGTGLTAPRKYIFLVTEKLREITGLGLSRAENLVDATQNADPFVEVSGILKAHAVNLLKISSDLRLLASGPHAGLGELRLPAVQAGSSIMPGKVNPVICEAVGQAALRAIANDAAVTQTAYLGQLELNAFLPLLADALLESIDVLTKANQLFADRCVWTMDANRDICARHVENSIAVVTVLVPAIGYAKAAEVAAEAKQQGKSVREIVLTKGLLEEKELHRLLSAESMTSLGYR